LEVTKPQMQTQLVNNPFNYLNASIIQR